MEQPSRDAFVSRVDVRCDRCPEPAVAEHTLGLCCEEHLDDIDAVGRHSGQDGAVAWLDSEGEWRPARQWWGSVVVRYLRANPPEAAALMRREPDAWEAYRGRSWQPPCMHHLGPHNDSYRCAHAAGEATADVIALVRPVRAKDRPEKRPYTGALCSDCAAREGARTATPGRTVPATQVVLVWALDRWQEPPQGQAVGRT